MHLSRSTQTESQGHFCGPLRSYTARGSHAPCLDEFTPHDQSAEILAAQYAVHGVAKTEL